MDDKIILQVIFWWGVSWIAAGPPALMMSVAAVLLAGLSARGRFDLPEIARAAFIIGVFAGAFREIAFSALRRRMR